MNSGAPSSVSLFTFHVMIIDQTIIAATDQEWEEDISEFPASEYDLEITLKEADSSPKVLTITKDTDTYVINIPNDLIAADEFGTYQYQYKFTSLEDSKVTIPPAYRGFITVHPDLNTEADTRTEDEKILSYLYTVRAQIAQRGHAQVSINGKAATFKSLNEIDAKIIEYQKRLGIYKTPRIINSFG